MSTLRRRPIADQARDIYLAARRTKAGAAAVAAVAKRLGITPEEARALLGLEEPQPPKEAT